MKSFLTFSLLLAFVSTAVVAANLPPAPTNQAEFEKESSSVVRNKLYYKPGKFELAATGGLMPYDDVNNQYFIGGKLAWHLTDSFGWEILDAQKASASITSWANNLVNDKNYFFVDGDSYFEQCSDWPEPVFSDIVHLTNFGNKKLAEIIFETLQKVI